MTVSPRPRSLHQDGPAFWSTGAFAMTPLEVMHDPRFSLQERGAYGILAGFWWQTGECDVPEKDLAKIARCSVVQWRRYVARLVDEGAIRARRVGQGQAKAYAPTSSSLRVQPITGDRLRSVKRSPTIGSTENNRSPVSASTDHRRAVNRSPVIGSEADTLSKVKSLKPDVETPDIDTPGPAVAKTQGKSGAAPVAPAGIDMQPSAEHEINSSTIDDQSAEAPEANAGNPQASEPAGNPESSAALEAGKSKRSAVATREQLDAKREVYLYYREKIQPRSRICPDKKILARLKTFTVDELKLGIDNFAADWWYPEHCGTNGAEWFFLSDARSEKFLTMKPRPRPQDGLEGAGLHRAPGDSAGGLQGPACEESDASGDPWGPHRFASIFSLDPATDEPTADALGPADPKAIHVWESALAELKLAMSTANFNSYLAGTAGHAFIDDEMTVTIGNPLVRETLEQRFRPHIARALYDVVGRPCRVVLVATRQALGEVHGETGVGQDGERERPDLTMAPETAAVMSQ